MGSLDVLEQTRHIDLPDLAATERLGRALAVRLRHGDVVALKGDLGSGKTTLARAVIAALNPAAMDVPSPTFTLVQTYEGENESGAVEVWHFDLYRLKHAEEAYDLAIEDAFADGISLIEWPERISHLLPRDHLEVALSIRDGEGARAAELKGGSGWKDRIEAIAGELN